MNTKYGFTELLDPEFDELELIGAADGYESDGHGDRYHCNKIVEHRMKDVGAIPEDGITATGSFIGRGIGAYVLGPR